MSRRRFRIRVGAEKSASDSEKTVSGKAISSDDAPMQSSPEGEPAAPVGAKPDGGAPEAPPSGRGPGGSRAVRGYEGDAGRTLAVRYESIDPETLHADVLHWLPRLPASVIDIGAGSGRDAGWFASKGYSVLAVEPSATMREEGRRRHPDPGITWLDDSLPGLAEVYRLGASFDVALLSAVWMHVPPKERERAFRKVVNLLKPNGMIVIRLKTGPVEEDRGMHPVSAEEIGRLARGHGAVVLTEGVSKDMLGRGDTKWSTLVLKFPDDGTGALPLLRHVILNDAKNTTYKLGLLQSVVRAADGSQGFASVGADGSDEVSVPLGLVALNWLRLYKPMIEADMPQAPKNMKGAQGLGFAHPGWNDLKEVAAVDFRAGARFGGARAAAVHGVLRKVADNIVKNPANFMTYPDTLKPIMRADKRSPGRAGSEIVMDSDYLRSFGEIRVPVTLWRAMARFGAWIEPALVNEWGRMVETFAERQGREIDPGDLAQAMRWHEPSRDVGFVRRRVDELMERGNVHCVWTGRKLREDSFDVDHCMPWAAWPCGDLWNLMPAHPSVNRNSKRHRLPAAATLERSAERILDWWDRAWHRNDGTRGRFLIEARASLPMLPSEPDLHSVFAGVQDRRFVIRADQGVEEWVQR